MSANPPSDLPEVLSSLPHVRIRIPARGWLFHAGQPNPGVCFVRAGFLRTSVGTDDGRERITAFPMRGEWIGLESLGSDCHVTDCVALDACEVLQFPTSVLEAPGVATVLAMAGAQQLRDQHAWALTVGSLCAERRVLAFLQDLGRRHARLGCSAHRFTLRMTRAEMGNFLGLQIETVTRALTKLQASGQLQVERREITLPATPTVAYTAPAPRPVDRGHTVSPALRTRAVLPGSHVHALM